MTFQDNPVLGRFTEAARAMDPKHEELKAAYQHIERMEAALQDCRKYLEGEMDIRDQLVNEINETLHGAGGF